MARKRRRGPKKPKNYKGPALYRNKESDLNKPVEENSLASLFQATIPVAVPGMAAPRVAISDKSKGYSEPKAPVADKGLTPQKERHRKDVDATAGLASLEQASIDSPKSGVKAPNPKISDKSPKYKEPVPQVLKVSSEPQNKKNHEENESRAHELREGEYDASLDKKHQLSLRYQIPKKLKNLSPQVKEKMSSWIDYQMRLGDDQRTSFLARLASYRAAWNDFQQTGINPAFKNGNNIHVPMTFEKVRALHARLYQAILGMEPIFTIRPRKAIAEIQKQFKEDLLQWATSDFANRGDGWTGTIDQDIWNMIADGTSITKHSWERDVRKFVDVEVSEKEPLELGPDGRLVTEEREVEREEVVYDGPIFSPVRLEDVYIVGNYVDNIDEADLVVHRQQYSRSDLLKMAKLGFFDEEAVEKVSKMEPSSTYQNSRFGNENLLKYQEDYASGIDKYGSYAGIKTYVVNEAYFKFDVDEDGIDEELVAWVEETSKTILRITYLERVGPGGKRPFVLKKLLPRQSSFYGIGLGEILYGLNNEMDMLHNMRLDYGTLQNLPFGFYRAASGINPEEIELGPGKLIPVEDPQGDVHFPRMNGGTAYGFQEEAAVSSYADKASGVNEMAVGSTEGQGAARTATGASILANAANAGIDIFIRRYQEGFKKNLHILDLQLQALLPLGTIIKVIGREGKDIYRQFQDRDSIKFEVDYCLEGNSSNSNKLIERDVSLQMLQTLTNPLFLQTGVVGPQNIYNAVKNVLQKFEYRNIDAYITAPEEAESSPYSAKDELSAILSGVRLPKMIADKHAEKLAFFDEFENSDDFGLLDAEHLPLYEEYKAWHQQIQASMEANANNPLMQNTGAVAPMLSASIASGGAPSGVAQQMSDMVSPNSVMSPGGTAGE